VRDLLTGARSGETRKLQESYNRSGGAGRLLRQKERNTKEYATRGAAGSPDGRGVAPVTKISRVAKAQDGQGHLRLGALGGCRGPIEREKKSAWHPE